MTIGECLRILVQGYPPSAEMIDSHWPAAIQQIGGLQLTCCITVLALAIGIPCGGILALWRGNGQRGWWMRLLRSPPMVLVELIRATPIMVLVLATTLLPFPLAGIRAPVQIWAVAAFTIYAAAYACETIRAGMGALQPGWMEAGRTLGLSRLAILRHISLPIICRTMLPSLIGVGVTVFKDTSVLVVVSAGELMTTARMVQASAPGDYLMVLALAAFLYWSVATLGDLLMQLLGRRFDGAVRLDPA